MESKKAHWENVFTNKNANEVSWTQSYPTISMQFIKEINLPKNAKIIEIGGGESFFVDALIEEGFTNITVLDISAKALEKAKIRLKDIANKITWIVADITEFETESKFDFWHDRAVFHFLTEIKDVEKYIKIVANAVEENGHFLLGTFSPKGPFKCSGLEIVQYDESEMKELFQEDFEMIKSYQEEHITPMNRTQSFQFGGFKKK
jgi:ubiquinone/menaquinone biosynthesis C-methylase UbiE